MKKIIIALALLASVQIAWAQQQVKTVNAAKGAIESALKAAQNAKKATNAATWIKLGEAYLDEPDYRRTRRTDDRLARQIQGI